MKQTIRLVLVAVMATAMVAFVGCEEEDEPVVVDPVDTVGGGGGNENDTAMVMWVDLGLPSGLLWASCNVGASAPEEYGDYFAWGETQPKEVYNWTTYAHGSDSNQLTKYCNYSYYGLNGFTDNLTTLQPADDAATARQGDGARIPTKDEWRELMANTTAEWTTLNGVNGRKFTAANGKSIFLPAAGFLYGFLYGSELYDAGSGGDYWSASLFTDNPSYAWYIYSGSDTLDMCSYYRNYGQSVRAVRARQN